MMMPDPQPEVRMELSEELEQAVREGLDALAEGLLPGTHVIIRVNGQPVAMFVLCTSIGEPDGTAFETNFFLHLESFPYLN
jgi:hypothetical protein